MAGRATSILRKLEQTGIPTWLGRFLLGALSVLTFLANNHIGEVKAEVKQTQRQVRVLKHKTLPGLRKDLHLIRENIHELAQVEPHIIRAIRHALRNSDGR